VLIRYTLGGMRFLRYQIRVSIAVWEILAIVAVVLAIDLAWPGRPGWIFVTGGFALGISTALTRIIRGRAQSGSTSCSPR
jgi:hypothetical protein